MSSAQSPVQHRSIAPFVVAALGIVAVWAKRAYPKASLSWLVKRLIGFVLGRVLPIRIPEITEGRGCISKIGSTLLKRGCRKPLIVTDEALVKHGLVQKCVDSLNASGMQHELFDKVLPNPPREVVDAGYEIYKSKGCDSIIAFGGGSPIDTAKVIGAKVVNPQPVENYEGAFRATYAGLKTLPPFVAVPTTAGTGSETTIAAIITIPDENKKINIMDLGLVPHMAILDPQILEKLPKHITAATGMDALTHAIESFLSGWASGFTRTRSLEAVTKIMKNLIASYDNGSDMDAREAMLNAAFKAGLAFTRANLGYVHAIAHQLGAVFHTPHGDANAMLLPHVLDFYLEDELNGGGSCACIDMYCELAVASGLAQVVPTDRGGKEKLAQGLVERVREMNLHMNIPKSVSAMKAADVPNIARRAMNEAHGELFSAMKQPLPWILDLGYPTPKYMTQAECEKIVSKVLPS